MGKNKHYCDYCDVLLTHNSLAVRKAHNAGRNHLSNVREYYTQALNENPALTQSIYDGVLKHYQEAGLPPPELSNPMSSGPPSMFFGSGPLSGQGPPMYNRPPPGMGGPGPGPNGYSRGPPSGYGGGGGGGMGPGPGGGFNGPPSGMNGGGMMRGPPPGMSGPSPGMGGPPSNMGGGGPGMPNFSQPPPGFPAADFSRPPPSFAPSSSGR